MKYYYAVRIGRIPGIYETWNECEKQIYKYPAACFKKFKTKEDAQRFINGDSVEEINESRNEINKLIENVNVVNGKNQINPKITYIYYQNYPGFSRPNFTSRKWKQYYYIFTDGSHRNRTDLQFKSGYGVFTYGNEIENIMKRNNETNNFCELSAIKEALQKIYEIENKDNKDKDINRQYIIVSDSQYCLKSVTQYLYVWKETNWKKANGSPMQHLEMWKEIYKLLYYLDNDNISVGFLHVNSHLKEPNDINSFDYYLWYGNRCADFLALGKMPPLPRIGFSLSH